MSTGVSEVNGVAHWRSNLAMATSILAYDGNFENGGDILSTFAVKSKSFAFSP